MTSQITWRKVRKVRQPLLSFLVLFAFVCSSTVYSDQQENSTIEWSAASFTLQYSFLTPILLVLKSIISQRLGRILNSRCSKDIGCIDEILPGTVIFTAQLFLVNLAIVLQLLAFSSYSTTTPYSLLCVLDMVFLKTS